MSSPGFYMWWVAEKGRPPLAEDTHVFQLCQRAWELRTEIDDLDDPDEIRTIREAWEDAAVEVADDTLRERVWQGLVEKRPELEHATVDLPDREPPVSGSFQFVWWGWGKWKNLGRLGPWPNAPHRPNHHGCIYSWRFNLGFLEIRRWT
jgi:hypothetical protein